MAKTGAERQKKYKKDNKAFQRRLDVYLPSLAFYFLDEKTQEFGVTKGEYLSELLIQDNGLSHFTKNENLLYSRYSEAEIKYEAEITELKVKVKELSFIQAKDKKTIHQLKNEIRRLKEKVKKDDKPVVKSSPQDKLSDRVRDFETENLKLGDRNKRSALIYMARIWVGAAMKGKISKKHEQDIYDWLATRTEKQKIQIINAHKELKMNKSLT